LFDLIAGQNRILVKMGKDGKPRGKMSSYAFFVQTCREEHKKKHPGEQVVFAEFSKKCSEKWKAMSGKEKHRFEEMAEKDKGRYDKEMQSFEKSGGKVGKGKRKKDPNAPKRSLSAFFCFCNDERQKVKAQHPNLSVGEIAKELGKRWEKCTNKPKYEAIAAKDKERYEREMAAYKSTGKKPAAKPAAKPKAAPVDDDDDDDEDEDDEEEDEESD
jgi:uncharacterized short protein YbdD (DUF466 family)